MVKSTKRLDPRFLFFVLSLPEYQSELVSASTGSANQANISARQIESLRIPLPPLRTQEAIAYLLGAIDDKVDLNRRMSKTLESAAQTIFEDWFVSFGPIKGRVDNAAPYLEPGVWQLFPDRLDHGRLPPGWKMSNVGAEFRLTMGQSPPGDTYNEKGDGLPFFQGRTDFGDRYPRRRMYCSAPTRTADADDTLVSVRAPVGDLNMAWEPCCIGRGVASVRHIAGHRGYTYYAMLRLQEDLSAFEHTGTVFGAINKAQFERLEIAAPPVSIVHAFENIVSGFDQRIRANTEENLILEELRDFLSPKLMSGEIRIREAEKAVAELV